MISDFERKALELLSKCSSLEDVERCFGGTFTNGSRNRQLAATSWGLWDGFMGLPSEPAGIDKKYHAAYRHAVEIGKKVAKAKRG